MPEISIIVPVYKVEDVLPRCIESIIAQTYRDWELILVDDGSPDNSGIICDRYLVKDERIKVLHTPNNGVSAARNAGLDIVKGNFVVFIDSDDWVDNAYLKHLLRYRGDENTTVYGNVINDYDYDKDSSAIFDYEDGLIINLDQSPSSMVKFRIPENGFPIAKLFSMSIIRKHQLRFDTSLSYHEDHLFVFEYLNHVEKIVLSSAADYHYVHRLGIQSLSKKIHKPANLIKASKGLINALDNSNYRWGINDSQYLKKMYTFLGLNQLIMALFNASREEFRMACMSIKQEYPRFRRFYKPGHSILKIIPVIINLNFQTLLIPILKWKGNYS